MEHELHNHNPHNPNNHHRVEQRRKCREYGKRQLEHGMLWQLEHDRQRLQGKHHIQMALKQSEISSQQFENYCYVHN